MSASVVGALAVAIVAAPLGAASRERRMTNAANVRLRSAPSTSASIEAELPLGSELVTRPAETGRDQRAERTDRSEAWYHVKTDEGREGWVLSRFTTPCALERRDQTIESVVVGRLQIGGSFSTLLRAFDLIDRTAARLNDREAQARFALHRLRSMSRVLGAVPFRRTTPTRMQAGFDPKARCGELHMSLDPLTAAATASVSVRKVNALSAIERFAELCR